MVHLIALAVYAWRATHIFVILCYLREFGVQTIRHLCACVRGVGLLSAVLLSGIPGVHFAQTLRFSRSMTLPPEHFEFKAFWASAYKNLSIA